MKLCKAFRIFAISALLQATVGASEPWPEKRSGGYSYGGPKVRDSQGHRDNPFYASQRTVVEQHHIPPYGEVDRNPWADEEVAIMRTSMTNYDTIKTCYDRKGNLISIHAWDRRTGQDRPVNLTVLANPIVKDEIESSVARLRVVYNNYGEVVSKQAWNKITGEKVEVPKTVPFTNYIDEDKYWAWVERQKLYERSYTDMYVDRGAVRTKRMKSLMRYNNPFGVPHEVEVYEERPIIERHYDESMLRNDGWIAMWNASLGGSISGVVANVRNSSGFRDASGSHLEVGADIEAFNRRFDIIYTSLSQSSTTVGASSFNGRNFATGSAFDFDMQGVDIVYRRPFIRSDRGDFGINWLFSLKAAEVDASLRNGAQKSSMSGTLALPMVGFEMVRNVSDHLDLFGHVRMFSLSDVETTEYQLGGKYYFHPERVDDWRASVGYKGLTLNAEDKNDRLELDFKGVRFALERSF
ncbi:MAG: hypothetical protein H3C47_05760 [Candidatus Cloacimonetes bacterium]|nr:hypothetical protein [Candidatus Cloacimonadota bacterium]